MGQNRKRLSCAVEFGDREKRARMTQTVRIVTRLGLTHCRLCHGEDAGRDYR